MNNLVGKFALAVCILSAFKPSPGLGQDFFRDLGTSRSSGGIGPVTPSDYTYDDQSPSGLQPLRPGQQLTVPEETEETDKYNFALGNFRFGLAAGVGFEFNDNITLSEYNRESDIIFRPVVNVDAEWRISDLNTLRFNVGFSYASYFQHTQYDTNGVLISPNSELELTVLVSNIKITLRDRFSYQEDTYDIPQLSGVANYDRYENQAGIQLDYPITPNLTLSGGYDHYNLWVTNDPTGGFNLQSRYIDTVYVKPSFQFNPAVKVGVNASYSNIQFEDAQRANGYGVLAGPFVDWQISEYTNMYLEGGYQRMHFDGSTDYEASSINQLGLTPSEAAAVASTVQDNDQLDSYYIKFEIDNRPSEFFKHRLMFSKTGEIGFDSNFYQLWNVEYEANWKPWEHVELGPDVFYEHYEASGVGGEKGDRIGAAVGIRYHFTNSLTIGLDYRYIWKNSDIIGNDYYQNLAFLSLYYKF
jgi:opacity protein-like surface antigen